ncbi:MAG: hypothetical protein AB7S26_01675 [Sandaracinaceae bacterium]
MAVHPTAWSLALVLAAGSVIAVSTPATTVAQAAPDEDGESDEARDDAARRARRDVPTIITAGTIWALAYVLDIATAIGLWADAGDDPFDLHRDLLGASFIPVAGPWVQLGVDPDDGRKAYWGILGGVQTIGLALLAVGHFVGHPDEPAAFFVPLEGGGYAGLAGALR